MENAAQIDAKNVPRGSRCNCENPSFEKKLNYPILGHVQCDYCRRANLDHFWVCQKDCGLKFCNACMDSLTYPKE